MSRRPARFTEADLARAAKAAMRTGMDVEVKPDGTIRLVRQETAERLEIDQIDDRAPQPLC